MKKFTEKIGSQTFDIFVGTNAKENWELIDNSDSFDLWFHVEDLPSGHVVVRERFDKQDKQDIIDKPTYPNQIISLAANYCKNQSKYKNQTKLKIVYTEISNIKKGRDIGSVFITKEKFIYI